VKSKKAKEKLSLLLPFGFYKVAGLHSLFLPSGLVAHLLEETPFDLLFHVCFYTSKHISEESPGTMPDVTKEEQQCKHRMTEGEPSPWTGTEHTVRV
jgi:hypothetical protein